VGQGGGGPRGARGGGRRVGGHRGGGGHHVCLCWVHPLRVLKPGPTPTHPPTPPPLHNHEQRAVTTPTLLQARSAPDLFFIGYHHSRDSSYKKISNDPRPHTLTQSTQTPRPPTRPTSHTLRPYTERLCAEKIIKTVHRMGNRLHTISSMLASQNPARPILSSNTQSPTFGAQTWGVKSRAPTPWEKRP